ncbi:unnamed protein product [Aphanomyces euteiches]
MRWSIVVAVALHGARVWAACTDDQCSIDETETSILDFDFVDSSTLTEPVARVSGYSASSYSANKPNEDRFKVHIEKDTVFASVLDGHGGWQVAEYVHSNLINNTKAELVSIAAQSDSDKDAAIASKLEAAFLRTDDDLKALLLPTFELGFGQVNRVGACTMLAYLRGDTLIVANAGDVRAVLATKNESGHVVPHPLSTDNNAKHATEKARLEEAHPNEDNIVVCKSGNACYVKGGLQPTRALGDFVFKDAAFNTFRGSKQRGGGRFIPEPYTPPYVLALPEVQTHKLTSDDQFLILGSDGLWDDVSNEEAVELVQHFISLGQRDHASQALVELVIAHTAADYGVHASDIAALEPGDRRQVHDDTTVVILFFT